MYDSITATDIPVNAEIVAGYLPPSRFAWSADDWGRFPDAVKVQIAVRATVNAGHVLDVEAGDATPAQAVSWVIMRRKSGADPTVYCSQMSFPAVVGAFNAVRVPQPHYWIAHYDGQAILPPGAVAKQYTDSPASGGHYDLSIVADYWPGVDQLPIPPRPDMELTDTIPSNPAPNTVGFVLKDLERGTININPAGQLALDIMGTTSAVTAITAQLTAIEAQLSTITATLAKLTPSKLCGSADVTVNLTPGV